MDTRELDARVAREVMGKINGNIPYSTNMNAAMEVVEKMRERGFEFDLNSEPYGCSCKFWKSFLRPRNETKESMALPGSYALAICLAALEAVAGKDKE